MLTAPTLFADKINQGGYIDGVILSLTDGVDTWLLGNIEVGGQWTDAHVYNAIEGDVSWTQTIDDITNDWSRVVLEITLTNIPYRKDTNGNDVVLSELLNNISGKTAKLYILNNPQSTELADCLNQFTGVFSKVISSSETSIIVELLDNAGFLFKQLATKTIKDVMGGSLSTLAVPNTKSRLSKVPIVYGKFQREPIQMGLSKAPLFNFDINEFVISEHPVKYIDKLYIVNGENVPPFLVDPTFTNNFNALTFPTSVWLKDDSGSLITSEKFFLNPTQEDRINPLDDIDKYGDGLRNFGVTDNNPSSFTAMIMDESTFRVVFTAVRGVGIIGISIVEITQMSNLLGFEIYKADRLKEMITQSEIAPRLFSNYIGLDANNSIDFVEEHQLGGVPNTPVNPQLTLNVHLVYSASPTLKALISSQSNNQDLEIGVSSPPQFAPVVNTAWQQVGFLDRSSLQDSNRDYGIIIDAVITGLDYATFGDIPDVFLFTIADLFLTLQGEFTAEIDSELFSGINAPFAFVACEGRAFGSWIDDGAWSNNMNEGELIQHPSMIIASLLIDEAGKSVSDLDTTTFDNAWSYPCIHRINIIDEKLTMKDVIQTLSNQSLGTFVWTASDKGRFIPLRVNTASAPTTDTTIRYDDLLDGFINVTDTDSEKIVNHLTIKSRWLEEESRFVDEDTYTNATSIAQYGTRKQILEFKQINSFDNSATIVKVNDWLALHFIDADEVAGTQQDDGYWSKQRGVISFTTAGHKCAENEVGDVIAIDSTTVDPHLLYKTATWLGQQFIIMSITQSGQFTTIEAKQVADIYAMIGGMRAFGDLD